jgi:hypothetical protein
MILNRPLLVLALGVAIVAPGCLATTDDPVTLEPAPELHTLGGGNGLNGLHSNAYWTSIYQLVNNLGAAQADAGGHLSSAFSNASLTQAGSIYFYTKVFPITTRSTVFDAWGNPFHGYGYDSSYNWPMAAVPNWARQQEILALLTAFVNNNSTSIPIAFKGSFVTSSDAIPPEFDQPEALIYVKQVVSGSLPIYEPQIWLDGSLAAKCNIDTYKYQRYCEGGSPGSCGFAFRNDYTAACVPSKSGGNTVCDGVPVLQTYLKSTDLCSQAGCCGNTGAPTY